MATGETQIFWWGEYAWNIGQADAIVAGREPSELEIGRWIADLAYHEIDEARWQTADLTKPLIVVPFPGTGELFLIDGWHRVRRAAEEHVLVLPGHVLTSEEGRRIRAYPEEQ